MTGKSFATLDRDRVLKAKAAYTTRRVPQEDMQTLIAGGVTPEAGDLVLARVEKVGRHQRIELATGRRSRLFVGDEILLCLGSRYVPDQFEAMILEGPGECTVIASGGIAAQVRCGSQRVNNATVITALGLIGDAEGRVLNLERYALPRMKPSSPRQVVLAVCSTAMNAGKTETAINLIKGLVHAGYRVGAAKVTGIGAGGDVWAAIDAGADPVLDFTDVGLASTYQTDVDRIERAAQDLLGYLSESDTDVIVLELVDGLLQTETAALLECQRFTLTLDGILFAAGDAVGALAGMDWLKRHQLNVLGGGGGLTRVPLAIRELEAVCGMPVFDMKTLSDPVGAAKLIKPFVHRSVCMA